MKIDAVIAAIGDAVSIQDTDFKILYQNKIHKDIIGDREGEFCYRAYEQREQVCEGCPVAMSFRDGEIHKAERRLIKDNEKSYFQITASPLKDSSGKIIAGIEVARDITEYRRAEEALQQSEEKYRNLIENIQDGIFIIQDARIQFANEAFAGISGYTVEEIIGKDFREFIAPEDLEMVVNRYLRRQAGENIPGEYEFRVLRKSGKIRLVNMNVGLITFLGRVASMGTIKDITERKAVEDELKIKALLLDRATDSIFVHDLEGNFIYLNEAAYKSRGYSYDEMMRMTLYDIVAPEFRRLIKQRIEELVEKGEMVFESGNFTRDKSIIPVEVHACIIESGDKKVVLSVIRDITERKQAEKMQKEKARAELNGFIVSALPVFASGVPSQVRDILVKNFAERFEKNVRPRFEEEMKHLSESQDIKDSGIGGIKQELEIFLSWLSRLFSNLDIQARISSYRENSQLEFFNCPWTGETKGNPIFCFMCRTMVMRSFNWTSLKGSVNQKSSIAGGSLTCVFEFHLNLCETC